MAEAAFGLKEAIDLLNSQTARSDGLWMFYWLVAGATLGLGYGKKIVQDNPGVKVGATVAFILFTVVNIAALWYTQETMAALASALNEAADDPGLVDPRYAPALKQLRRATGPQMLRLHLPMDACVLLGLWLPNLIARLRGRGRRAR